MVAQRSLEPLILVRIQAPLLQTLIMNSLGEDEPQLNQQLQIPVQVSTA